jgi:outer membrane lipoprotein-sorting protein
MLRLMTTLSFRFALSVISPVFACLMAIAPAVQAADAAALKEARTALEALSAKNRNAASVSLAFTSRVMGADGNWTPSSGGSLVTADSGRFRLKHAQGTVISDGRTLWQHFPSTKQVVIRAATRDGGNAGGVLLRFLQAKALSADRAAGGLRITLDPASVGENLDSLVITLSSDVATVRRVETQDPAGNRAEYAVTSLRYDGRPGRGAFTFKVPDGVEVVDMR